MKEYIEIVKSVLNGGEFKSNRTGVDTISKFGVAYKIPMSAGFPLLTTKKVSWKNILVENLWFLSGKSDIGFLRKHGCKFWEPWADSEGRVPSAYGNIWRHFAAKNSSFGDNYDLGFDQIKWVLKELRENSNSRRLVVSAWDPNNACQSKLPPCHYTFVLNVQRGRLNLHMTQRSCSPWFALQHRRVCFPTPSLRTFRGVRTRRVRTFHHRLSHLRKPHRWSTGTNSSKARLFADARD